MIRKSDLRVLFSEDPIEQKQYILEQLAPQLGVRLEQAFTQFLENEQQLNPTSTTELAELFNACSDETKDAQELLSILYALAPGNGHIGFRQVNFLVESLRKHVGQFIQRERQDLKDLRLHDHIFGSGGDFCKTIHASTVAAIIVAPLIKICKTGTTNVTSCHGSAQAMAKIGYNNQKLDIAYLNYELADFGFAFVPLSLLGFPYSRALKEAREQLWHEAKRLLEEKCAVGETGWQDAVRNTKIPLDIFKIVSPNAQVLNPIHHSTGVCHTTMIPYVLSLYLHLGSQGFIAHSYDAIDEIANASSDLAYNTPNNLLIQVDANEIRITEFSPEDLGFVRAKLEDIREEEDLSITNNDCWRIVAGEEKGPKRDFIVANAALLLVAAQQVPASSRLIDQLRVAIKRVEDLIDSHASEQNFRQLLATRKRLDGVVEDEEATEQASNF